MSNTLLNPPGLNGQLGAQINTTGTYLPTSTTITTGTTYIGGNPVGALTTGTATGNWNITNQSISAGGMSTWLPEPTILERLANLKALEELKKEHSIDEFHILVEYNTSHRYVFLTDKEMSYFRKYSASVDEIVDPTTFEAMLKNIEEEKATVQFGLTGESYDTIEDLRKDHLVLKLSGIG